MVMPNGDFNFEYLLLRDTTGQFFISPEPSEDDVKLQSNSAPVPAGQPVDIDAQTDILDGTYDYVGEVDINGGSSQGYVVFNINAGQFYLLTDTEVNFPGGQTVPLGPADPTIALPVCFMAGTRILTPGGEIAVEQLKIGDMVQTSSGSSVPVRWIGRQTISQRFANKQRVLPIRLRAGALADQVPSRDLLLSADHAVMVDNVLIHAGSLVNGTSITREVNVPVSFTYYHVETDDHSLILAENTPAETFIDNVDRMAFDNWNEYQALYPEGKAVVELPYPRAKAYRQVPRAIRERLASRGSELYGQTLSSAA
jgi:hypothetical protein